MATGLPSLGFEVGDGRDLPFGDASFEVVAFHTTLCHVPEPVLALQEAHRVLRDEGTPALLDGDYATLTVAIGPNDPLQTCVDEAVAAMVHDPWLVRRLRPLVASAGLERITVRGHAYTQLQDPGYLLEVVEVGADMLAGAGRIQPAGAQALKGEARARVAAGSFFGFCAYASLTARRGRSGTER